MTYFIIIITVSILLAWPKITFCNIVLLLITTGVVSLNGLTGGPDFFLWLYAFFALVVFYDGYSNYGTPGTITFGAGNMPTCFYNIPIDDGVWHHIAGVVDRSNNMIYLFVDGDLKDQNSFTSVNPSEEPFNGNHFVLSGGIGRIIAT